VIAVESPASSAYAQEFKPSGEGAAADGSSASGRRTRALAGIGQLLCEIA
jgi:hypothetical protein